MILHEDCFTFGTKAETLESLTSRLSLSHIPRFYYFSVTQWKKNQQQVLKNIRVRFKESKVIVRSSADGEDAHSGSLAGFFDSVSHVSTGDSYSLDRAINQVIASYKRSHNELRNEHQVLVQQLIEDISMSGVVMTQDLNTGAPYYVINYDDETGRTDTVTAGTQHSNRTLLVHRDSVQELGSERFMALLSVVQEIERVTGHDSLDIEFAVDKNNKVYLFQVRPISLRPNWNRSITLKINDALAHIKTFVAKQKSIFTTMSDWNPAEMIGTSPRPLALSLYRYLITDSAWRKARQQMGYFEPPGAELMTSLSGKPYIDVGLSFSSFVPQGVTPALRKKLVNAWKSRLSQHKELHDKVEFEIATTALTFNFDAFVHETYPDVLTKAEYESYKKALFHLTNNLITGRVSSIQGELDKVALLSERRGKIVKLNKKPTITTVATLLKDCITLGTIPFSILARHAFIATSFIRSLAPRGVFSTLEAEHFQKSIKTVASDFVTDIDLFIKGSSDKSQFMEKYGHLRPGTYDILSKRYDQRDDLLTGTLRKITTSPKQSTFAFTPVQQRRIQKLLSEYGYKFSVTQFLDYIQEAIAAREYSKFIFTKNVSDALEIIAAWGQGVGLSREELSYIPIEDILNAANNAEVEKLEQFLRDCSVQGKAVHEITKAIRLPYLIERPEDISIIPLLINKPNFITHKNVRGQYVLIDGKSEHIPDIAGKIAVIESADPGFDWIFSRPIIGLVTKFGGANSHMAIRCAEFGLPAAIGCGEQIFDRILRCTAIELDCAEGRIEPIEL